MQVYQVQNIDIYERLYLNPRLRKQRKRDQNIQGPSNQEKYVVVQRAYMLRVHICIHIPDPTFDRIIAQILPISPIC